MVGISSLQWLLTVAFAGAAVFHLVRLTSSLRAAASRGAAVLPPTGDGRISESLHLAMSVAMIVMLWPWGARVPAIVWIVVFTASTGWFVVRTVRVPGRRLSSGFIAVTTAAMVWMAASPAHAAAGGTAHHDHAAGHSAADGYAAWISAGLGTFLVLVALWWVARALRLGSLHQQPDGASVNWPGLCHGVMSAGMGLALLSMM